jgi:nucleotide-binding universal stress UspA family protein
MKTILALIDYSTVSINALHYAADLALSVNAKLVLLHVYETPLPMADAPVMAIAPEVLEKENITRLKQLQQVISEKVRNAISVESFVQQGFATEQIIRGIKKTKADLVVMGTTDKGEIMRTFMGSTTSSVMKKSVVPVLVIPEKTKFSRLDKIVYACDFEKINDRSTLRLIKEITKLFHAELMVLSANNRVTVPLVDDITEGIELKSLLSDVKHSYWHSEETDIIAAVNEFVEKHNIKIVVMIARKYLFPENIVHRSLTKRMALKPEVPFLFMHE